MKVLRFLSVIFVTSLIGQFANAHPNHSGDEDSVSFYKSLKCDYSDVEGVWRINTIGKQSTMKSGGHISFARNDATGRDPNSFVVTGNGFGKLENTPVFFVGSCKDNIYVLTGNIVVGGNLLKVAVERHPKKDYKGEDDDCDARGSTNPASLCKQVAHRYQKRFITIDIAAAKATESSTTSGHGLKAVPHPGLGHAHGGGPD